MKKANISNISQAITLVEQNAKTKAKKTLYLVLKKRLWKKIIVSIYKELEKRLIEYLKNIAPLNLNEKDKKNLFDLLKNEDEKKIPKSWKTKIKIRY